MLSLPNTFSELVAGIELNPDKPFPYAHLVPTDPVENRKWREWAAACGEKSVEDQKTIGGCCLLDFLFFINGFLYIKQEHPKPETKPFILWNRQREYALRLVELRRAVSADQTGTIRGDIGSDKPRQQGWSWLNLAEGLHIALFTKGATCIIGSRVEDDVDKIGSSKSLFWKLDFFIENLPRWMIPGKYWSASRGYPTPNREHRSKLKLSIPGSGTIIGNSTHENFGRSGGFAWMMLDEFAHVDRGQQGMGDKIWAGTAENCRMRRVLSTPNGRTNKFAQLRWGNEIEWFTTHWYDDPLKTVGAYPLTHSISVGPITIEKGELWSPWCDSARKTIGNDALFAQEILLSYEGTGGQYYDALLPLIKQTQIKKPEFVGNLEINGNSPRVIGFKPHEEGMFTTWEPIPDSLIWPSSHYIMGIDVASGSKDRESRGASNSAVAIGRLERNGERTRVRKIAQYMTHGLAPHKFARIVCALGYVFPTSANLPAYAIWEVNGPGEWMGGILTGELGYRNFYSEVSLTSKGLANPGFRMQMYRKPDGKPAGSKINVFELHKETLQTGEYEEPSFDTYREMEQYHETEGGPEHVAVRSSLNANTARSNHGDSTVATVLMLWGARKIMNRIHERPIEFDPPKTSIAFHHRARAKRGTYEAWK